MHFTKAMSATAALSIGALTVTGAGLAAAAPGASTAQPTGTSSVVLSDWGGGWGSGSGSSGGLGGDTGGWGSGSSGTMPGYGQLPGSDSGSVAEETLSQIAQAAADEITPSVVNIDTVLDYGTSEAAGTGIVISSDGLVLTNHHVVEGSTDVTATVVGTDTTYEAEVLGYDATTDIAVIQLIDASGLPVATLGDSDSVELGDLVVGVGNAGGDGGDPTSVEGVVTELDQTITATDSTGGNAETLSGLIGTDANIQAGQSGGPLVDEDGDVVGVDVAASSSSGYSTETTSGYAIPIDDAIEVANQIIAGQESDSVHIGATAFLGVQLSASSSAYGSSDQSYGSGDQSYGFGGPGATPQSGSQYGFGDQGATGTDEQSDYSTSGVTIAGVVDGSAAQSAGLAAGDTITSFAGTTVTSAEDLSALVAAQNAGDSVTLVWTDSSGAEQQATVTLGEGPVG